MPAIVWRWPTILLVYYLLLNFHFTYELKAAKA